MTTSKATGQAKIINRHGIHCRPSSIIINAMVLFPGVIFEIEKKGSNDGKAVVSEVMDLMSLGLEHDEEVTVSTSGPDAVAACAKLIELLTCNFDFERG